MNEQGGSGRAREGEVMQRVSAGRLIADGESLRPDLLDAVAVVDVYVNVQHALMPLEQFQDGEHNVVDVTETRCFRALGMM